MLVNLLDVEVDELDEPTGVEHLLWMRSWEMWPHLATSIGLEQFEALKRGFGMSETVSEKPAVLFSCSEVKSLIACALSPLVFGWDCYIIPSSAEYTVFISHDECIEVATRSDEVQARLLNELERWGPESFE